VLACLLPWQRVLFCKQPVLLLQKFRLLDGFTMESSACLPVFPQSIQPFFEPSAAVVWLSAVKPLQAA